MKSVAFAGIGLSAAIQMCGGGASGGAGTSTGFSCDDYQLMLDVEVRIASECDVDEDCQQVLDGTGCGCPTDDLVVNSDFDPTYFFDTWDEALGEACPIEFETTCDCDASAIPRCQSGSCVWR